MDEELKIDEVERRLDKKEVPNQQNCYPPRRIIINSSAPYFKGEKAVIAYVGSEGVSVYLMNPTIFDDLTVLKFGEFDFA